MKTSSVLASVLFGSLAAAAPLQKRAMATATRTVVETVVVYTTVWDGEAPAATSAPALFYERPGNNGEPSSAAAVPTPVDNPPVNTPPAVPESSSVYTPPAAPSPPAPSSEVAPLPEAPTPVPEPTPVYSAPPAPASSAPAEPSVPTTNSGNGGGYTNTGGSLTMHYFSGALGACGQPIPDDSNMVALGTDVLGPMTWDPATGNPTNKWCGQKIEVTYEGNTAEAIIMDACSGCTNGGLDVPPGLWQTLTGGVGGASGDRLSGMTWTAI